MKEPMSSTTYCHPALAVWMGESQASPSAVPAVWLVGVPASWNSMLYFNPAGALIQKAN